MESDRTGIQAALKSRPAVLEKVSPARPPCAAALSVRAGWRTAGRPAPARRAVLRMISMYFGIAFSSSGGAASRPSHPHVERAAHDRHGPGEISRRDAGQAALPRVG